MTRTEIIASLCLGAAIAGIVAFVVLLCTGHIVWGG